MILSNIHRVAFGMSEDSRLCVGCLWQDHNHPSQGGFLPTSPILTAVISAAAAGKQAEIAL